MADEDLSKLKIDRSARALPAAHRKRWVYGSAAAVLLILVLSALYLGGVIRPARGGARWGRGGIEVNR